MDSQNFQIRLDMKNIEIDYSELKLFLLTLDYRKIKDGSLKEAVSRRDIEMFYESDKKKSKITLDQVIEYNKPFLVDVLGNDLTVCILTKRKYKTPTGRTVNAKIVKTIIDDCKSVFGSCLNGYWVIPDRFIKNI